MRFKSYLCYTLALWPWAKWPDRSWCTLQHAILAGPSGQTCVLQFAPPFPFSGRGRKKFKVVPSSNSTSSGSASSSAQAAKGTASSKLPVMVTPSPGCREPRHTAVATNLLVSEKIWSRCDILLRFDKTGWCASMFLLYYLFLVSMFKIFHNSP